MRIIAQAVIQVHNIQCQHQLPFILVQPLNLNIKNRPGIHLDIIMLFNVLSQSFLIFIFDPAEILKRLFIPDIIHQVLQMRQIHDPGIADLISDPFGQLRIAMQQETPLGNAVGLVVKLFRIHRVKVFKRLFFQNLSMQSGHAVDRIAADNGQMRHLNLAVRHDRHSSQELTVVAELINYLRAEAAVNFLNDLVNPQQQAAEYLNRPFLQGFAHNRMIGISAALSNDRPSLGPLQAFLVNQNPHQLRHRQRRMSIVDMESYLAGQLFKVVVLFLKLINRCLQSGRNKEILLF